MSLTRRVRFMMGVSATVALVALPACHPGSGVDHSGGGADCSGYWTSFHNPYQFGLRDNAGGSDDDWCYIDFGPTEGTMNRRVSIVEDSNIGQWQYRPADMGGIAGPTIWWKICEERQNDPDLCSSNHENSI